MEHTIVPQLNHPKKIYLNCPHVIHYGTLCTTPRYRDIIGETNARKVRSNFIQDNNNKRHIQIWHAVFRARMHKSERPCILTDPNHYVIRAPVRDYAPKTTLINVFEGWISALVLYLVVWLQNI